MAYEKLIVPPAAKDFKLAHYDPGDACGFENKEASVADLALHVERLEQLQDVFAAQNRYALLIVLQGMDAAGKDGVIKHVMSGVNPQGINVHSFRAPSVRESSHDYLWRTTIALPERGRIAIFNRSYFEEVLVARVHPELLERQGIEVRDGIWHERYEDINAYERHLTRCGTIVLKFFLHLSKGEQRKRLLARLETPAKMWKASDSDLVGHADWDRYVEAYEGMLAHTSTPWAPWYVVPADRKWVSRCVVGGVVVAALEKLGLQYPVPSAERRAQYAKLAAQLERERSEG